MAALVVMTALGYALLLVELGVLAWVSVYNQDPRRKPQPEAHVSNETNETHENKAKLFPLWDHASPSCAPLGLPMCQNRLAVPTWSFAFERIPPARIIELGSYSGALACALGVHAWWLGVPVISYDRMEPNQKLAPLAKFLGVDFRVRDLYTPDTEAEIIALVRQPGATYLLCDGGNKQRELSTYAQHLKPGDVIAAHDYCAPGAPPGDDSYWPWSEMPHEHGERVAAANGLEPFMQQHMDMAGWLAYRRPA